MLCRFLIEDFSKEDGMMRRNIFVLCALLMIAFFNVAQAAPCDRDCLAGFVTKYVDALLARNPAALPLAADVKFTEDTKELKLGEGVWKKNLKPTQYRRDILDVRQGTAISFLVLEENNAPILYVVRLKIDDNKISEIESTVVMNKEEGMLFNPDNLKTVRPEMLAKPEKSQMNTRDEMIKIAVTYPEGLKVGSFVKVDSPMKQDAYRYENGNLMAGPGCTFFKGCDVMKTQTIPRLSGLRYRVMAVDEELGVVSIRMNFGPGSLFSGKGELDVWHSFKIFGGQIHAAEAYCESVPPGTKSGWENGTEY
jgi:hypothetical protein